LTRRTLHGCLAAVLALSLITLAVPAPALADDLDLDPSFAADPIPEIWAQADGDTARNGGNSSWIWGPVIHAATHEPYADSPDGFRAVYYFDKARMEINDPDESWESIWYATSGLLIREMMLGRIQVGDHLSIETAPAEIPVTGDIEDNPDSPTYATLAQHTSIGEGNGDRRAEDRTGDGVTTKLLADGSVRRWFAPPTDVRVAYYDDTLGHNVPDVFWNWMNAHSIGWQYFVGHPLTEAYWVDTLVAGEERVVLVQAFERRILTFTPDNPPEWQVEAGNAGLHYRAWRGLTMPEDESLHALAHGIPYGEIIVDAAVRNDVSPFLLAGVARAASDFDPLARLADDRVGLLGVPEQLLEQRGIQYPFDPTLNAMVAADILAMLYNGTGDWESSIQQYFEWQDAIGTFAAMPEDAASTAIASWNEFRERFEGQPSPFDVDVEEVRAQAPDPGGVDRDSLRFIGSGEAAHYGKEAFPVERMEHILDLHVGWGNAIDGWEYDPNGYYCVHPDFRPGERLHLTAPNGSTFWCTIGDSVAADHVEQWRSRWAIEVNWDLFEAMGVPYQQTIEVRAPIE
jgi:hypothetical protein